MSGYFLESLTGTILLDAGTPTEIFPCSVQSKPLQNVLKSPHINRFLINELHYPSVVLGSPNFQRLGYEVFWSQYPSLEGPASNCHINGFRCS